MLAVTAIIQNPQVLMGLNVDLPGAAWIGLQDFGRTFLARLRAATPIGWKWIPIELSKTGEKAVRAGKFDSMKDWTAKKLKERKQLKRGTGKWKKSGKLRKSWELELEPAARGVSLATDMPYPWVIERGLYPNPPAGKPPKGVPWTPWRVSGGFSKQAEKGMVGPLLDDEGLQQRGINMIVRQIRLELERVAGG